MRHYYAMPRFSSYSGDIIRFFSHHDRTALINDETQDCENPYMAITRDVAGLYLARDILQPDSTEWKTGTTELTNGTTITYQYLI